MAINMTDSYSSLDNLVEQDGESRRYFESLPQQMKQAALSSAESIHSFDSLRECVENELHHSASN